MAFAMTRPYKHPLTGIYWFRKRVPTDLVSVVGKKEEKRSLQTRDAAEAKSRAAEAVLELDTRWANLRKGARDLSEREAHELAARFYHEHREAWLDSPSIASIDWDTALGSGLWNDHEVPGLDAPIREWHKGFVETTQRLKMRDWCMARAQEVLAERGMLVGGSNEDLVARAISAAMQKAGEELKQLASAGFDYGRPSAGPQTSSSAPARTAKQKVPFKEIFEGWKKETRPVEKTSYDWKRVIDQFCAFVGHDDAAKLTEEDLIRWKDSLVEAGLKNKTISFSKIAPVRAILKWATQNRKLDRNVAERIKLDAKAKPSERKRGYTDQEAQIVLRAARLAKQAFKRWVPWIGAYSGARVSEICQLRREDVFEEESIWCMKLVPEAGSIKTEGSERIVPIHSALLAEGFLDFVKSVKKGPLFSELSPDRFSNRGGNGTRIIGRWIRDDLGIIDKRISPSHSWRHRLKTLARRHEVATDIADALTGHRRATVGDSYGEFPVVALKRELEKIPSLTL